VALVLSDMHYVQAGTGDGVAESCYTGEIPQFVESGLTRLYRHIHSSLAFFETSRPMDGASAYVAGTGGGPVTILMFRREGREIVVLNEMLFIAEAEVNRFAAYVFENFRSVSAIRFPAVRTDLAASRFPVQRYNSKEDWVIDLPATPAEYTARLSKKTREQMRSARNRIRRDFPSFTEETLFREDIGIDLVREIVGLSRDNIMAKKKMFGIDEDEILRIARLAKRTGVANVLRIDGRVCAGTINYTDGTSCLGEVIAHDSAYDRYSLGALTAYTTICGSIARGERAFHMGGGRNPYKAKLLGVRQDMDCLVLYRSFAHVLLNPRRVAGMAVNGWVRRAKVWLLEHEKSAVTQSVFNTLALLRKMAGGPGRQSMSFPSSKNG